MILIIVKKCTMRAYQLSISQAEDILTSLVLQTDLRLQHCWEEAMYFLAFTDR